MEALNGFKIELDHLRLSKTTQAS